MDAAPGEVPQEPRVDGAERQLAAPRALARPGHRVEQPADLRPGEVGIEHEPRSRPDRRLDPVRPEPLAELGGTPALPHDGRVDGTTRGPIPNDRRLPLVGDPDRGDRAPGGVAPRERGARGGDGGRPDLVGIVLDPARARVVLREFRVAAGGHPALRVHAERGRARGALIEGENHRPAGVARRGRRPVGPAARGQTHARADRNRCERATWLSHASSSAARRRGDQPRRVAIRRPIASAQSCP